MSNVATDLVLVPGAVALLVLLVFTYLYEQSRHSYFRAWQLAWAAYTLHYAIEAVAHFRGPSVWLSALSSALLVVMAACVFASTRLMKEPFQLKWYDSAIVLGLIALAAISAFTRTLRAARFREDATVPMYLRLEDGAGRRSASIPLSLLPLWLSAEIPSPSACSHSRWRCGACSWARGSSGSHFLRTWDGWAAFSDRFRKRCSRLRW